MAEAVLKVREESVQEGVHCGWCRGEAAVELDGRPYCGTCFLWIAMRKHPAEADPRYGAAASGYFDRANPDSR